MILKFLFWFKVDENWDKIKVLLWTLHQKHFAFFLFFLIYRKFKNHLRFQLIKNKFLIEIFKLPKHKSKGDSIFVVVANLEKKCEMAELF